MKEKKLLLCLVSNDLGRNKGEKTASFPLSGKCDHSLGEVLSVQALLSLAERVTFITGTTGFPAKLCQRRTHPF